MKKVLLCDIDDVLWDLVTPWCEYFSVKYGKTIPVEIITDWNISKLLDEDLVAPFYSVLDEDEFWDYLITRQKIQTINENAKALKMLSDNFELYIVTSTDYHHTKKLDLFFTLYGDSVSRKNLIIAKNKALLTADIVIDDRAETLFEFDKQGVRCVKINKPWNYWFNCEGYDSFSKLALKLLDSESEV